MKRRGFTLIELLVVIAIIGVLIALLVPAIQKVREAANRLSCQNNLKQLALATANYHGSVGEFPPGYERSLNHNGGLFCFLLPYIEQEALYQRIDWTVPSNNQTPGGPATAAIKGLICPSATIPSNPEPLAGAALMAGVTSYGGNGGTMSLPQDQAKNDGLFHETGPLSKPKANQAAIRMGDVLDGQSQTILMGERTHTDGAWDSWLSAPLLPKPVPPLQPFTQLRVWAPAGPMALYQITHSGAAVLNGNMGKTYIPPPPPGPGMPMLPPPPVPLADVEMFIQYRWMAYGSHHSGGVNFAFLDGSTRFIATSIAPSVMLALSSRAGGEAPGGW
jgi:prepilin-type N-terminal cleavage/methylation domain-containing protein/prepilin-type processing-associated H-X9-DG protein